MIARTRVTGDSDGAPSGSAGLDAASPGHLPDGGSHARNRCTSRFCSFPGVTQLDLTGPAQVLSRLGDVKLDLVARSLDPVPTDAQFALLPTATFADVPRTDILCVPGGFGTVAAMEDAATLGWVRQVAAEATWITSVCTGSLILAAAGAAHRLSSRLHWASRDQLAWFSAEPVAERVVFDRNRVTGGGVTAGIDFALALTAAIRGEDHARFVQLSLEYDPAARSIRARPSVPTPRRWRAIARWSRKARRDAPTRSKRSPSGSGAPNRPAPPARPSDPRRTPRTRLRRAPCRASGARKLGWIVTQPIPPSASVIGRPRAPPIVTARPSICRAAVAPSATTARGRSSASSRSYHQRHALISPALGFAWMRRLPRCSNLKCLTALVT